MVSIILKSPIQVLEVLKLLYDGTLNTLFYKSNKLTIFQYSTKLNTQLLKRTYLNNLSIADSSKRGTNPPTRIQFINSTAVLLVAEKDNVSTILLSKHGQISSKIWKITVFIFLDISFAEIVIRTSYDFCGGGENTLCKK